MNLNKLKKEIHKLLIKTDKYKCPECCGVGIKYIPLDDGSIVAGHYKSCLYCNGSDNHADTSKLLMDIISQLVFALKAWEDWEPADYDGYNKRLEYQA